MIESIILIGGGGHCKSCIDVIEQEGKFKIKGIIDLPEKFGQKTMGYPVIANDSDIVELTKRYKNFLITLGQIKSSQRRKEIFDLLLKLNVNLPVIISPRAYVSRYSSIGKGTIIMHDAIVNANATIGINCIINSKSLIEHDAKIGNYCHISTGAIVNGTVSIGNSCFIGSGSVIVNGAKVPEDSFIKASELFRINE